MSPRKPTVDGFDDVDDEDGLVEEEGREETDLSLEVHDAEDVGLGGALIGGADEVEEDDADWEVDDEDEDEARD